MREEAMDMSEIIAQAVKNNAETTLS